MPEVSVIIPTYNRAKSLRKAVQSVLKQTYRDLEIIVVDDGSDDSTEEVAREVFDPKLRYIKHGQNRGAAAARNTGLGHASGRYVAFQDSDDEWLPQKLEIQMEIFEHGERQLGVVHTGFSRFRGEESALSGWLPKHVRSGDIGSQILKGNFIGTPTALVRRECFEKAGMFDVRLQQLEDWEIWIRIAQYYKFAYIDHMLVTTYDLPDSLSADLISLISAHKHILEKHLCLFEKDKTALAAELYWIGNLLCQAGEMDEGREYFLKALKRDPLGMKCLVGVLSSLLGKRIYSKAVGLRRKNRGA